MPDHAISIAALLFAAMAGVGSVVRTIQNFHHHRFMKKVHAKKRKK
jgi:hypothetical protein